MAESKPRSAFLPILLLIVGVVVCAGVVLAFVPMVECECCEGLGTLSQEECFFLIDSTETGFFLSHGAFDLAFAAGVPCKWCGGGGNTSALRTLMEEPPDDIDLGRFGKDLIDEVWSRRQSTP